MFLFHPKFTVFQKKLIDPPPTDCDVIAVVDAVGTHCWVLVYRPPSCTSENTKQLFKCLDSLLTMHQACTIIGDFNMRHIRWGQALSDQQLDPTERRFVQWCDLWNLSQIVTAPTRGSNYLDLILTTHPERYGDTSAEPPLVNSDHDTVICRVLSTAKCSSSVRSDRCFLLADYGSIAHHLSLHHWPITFSKCVTIDDYWLTLRAVLDELVDKFVPVQTKHRETGARCHRPRLPKPVRRLVLQKRKAWRCWKRQPTPQLKADFAMASRRCRAAIRQHTAAFENRLLAAGSRKFYRFASGQLHPQSDAIKLHNGAELTGEPSVICNLLKHEFAKNFESTRSNVSADAPNLTCSSTSPRMSSVNVDVHTVRLILSQLQDSAAGPDGLPAVFYKRLAYWLAVPLSIIYQQSLHQQRIPDEWRMAKVIPLYKGKGDRTDSASYRPISLTAIACKVLERLVVDQLRLFLTDNTLLCSQQHGFLPKRSTTTNLLQCDSIIAQHFNNGSGCDIILLDFAKAFDKVSHAILLSKLSLFGIEGGLHNWVADFLRERSQVIHYPRRNVISHASGLWRGTGQRRRPIAVYIADQRFATAYQLVSNAALR